jgi:hypothetical protein
VPVLDDVADAGRRADVVLEDEEAALLVPDDVGAADVHVGPVRQVEAPHGGAVVRVAEDELGREHAVAEDPLPVVEVLEQQIDRCDPLAHAALDLAPLAR